MRILFLTPRLPYPANRGDRVRMLNFARVLSREHELHLLSFVESAEERSEAASNGQYFATVDTVVLSQKQQTLNMAKAIVRGRSLWLQRFRSAEMQRKIRRHLQNGAFDLVYCYTIRTGMYMENCPGPYRILDFVDAVFLMVSRMSAHTRSWPKRMLLNREARLIESAQVKMGPRFDECWMVSAADRDALSNWRDARVRVVQNGVDASYFAPQAVRLPGRPTLLFVGYLGQESVAALTKFCGEALPSIVEQFPDVSVNIVGSNAPPSIVAMGKDTRIRVLGFVPDLRSVYSGAHLLIAPMPFVAGVQNKVLEALAMGIPAVVTRYANEGIKAGPEQGVLVVENISEVAAGVKSVLSDLDGWRQRASHNGRRFVAERFRWEVAAERVRQIAADRCALR